MTDKRIGRPKKDEPLRNVTFNSRVTTEEREMMRAVFKSMHQSNGLIKSETDVFVQLYLTEAKRLKISLPVSPSTQSKKE